MSVYMPTGRLLEICQLALSLFQMQPVTVCKAMSFLDKAYLCINECAQLCYLCCVIQNGV